MKTVFIKINNKIKSDGTYLIPNNTISDIIVNFSYCEDTNKCIYDIENSYIEPNNSEKIINYKTKGETMNFEYCTLGVINIIFLEKKLVISALRYTKMPYNYIINSNTDIILEQINISGFIEINECASLTLGYVDTDSYILFNSSGNIYNINGEVKSLATIAIIGENINNNNGLITGNNLNIQATNINNENGRLCATQGVAIGCENILNNMLGLIKSTDGISIDCNHELNNMLGLIECTNGTIYIKIDGSYSLGIRNEIGRIKSFDKMTIIIMPDNVNSDWFNELDNTGGFIKSLALIKIISGYVLNSYGVIDGSDILIATNKIVNIHGALISKSINVLVPNTDVNNISTNDIIITNDCNCNCNCNCNSSDISMNKKNINILGYTKDMIQEAIIKKIAEEAIISYS